MKGCSIVLVALPQSDGMYKLRPAFVLGQIPPYQDLLVCGISTQIKQYQEGFDLLIDEQHPDFARSGLRKPSVIRLNFLSVISLRCGVH